MNFWIDIHIRQRRGLFKVGDILCSLATLGPGHVCLRLGTAPTEQLWLDPPAFLPRYSYSLTASPILPRATISLSGSRGRGWRGCWCRSVLCSEDRQLHASPALCILLPPKLPLKHLLGLTFAQSTRNGNSGGQTGHGSRHQGMLLANPTYFPCLPTLLGLCTWATCAFIPSPMSLRAIDG